MKRSAEFAASICAMAIGLSVGVCGTAPIHKPGVAAGTTVEKRELLSSHVLEVNADGFLKDLRRVDGEHFIKDGGQLREYLRTNLFESFAASGKKKLLLFVHGGLNSQQQGLAHFTDDYQQILKGDYYPVFVVWPSGWRATYAEHLFLVRQGVKPETAGERAFGILTFPFMFVADLGRAITRLPLVISINSRSDFETVAPIRLRAGGAAVQQYQDLAREGFNVAIGDDYSLKSDRFVRGMTYWLTLPIKHIVSSFIDGLGQGAWDDMLRRTQEVYPGRAGAETLQNIQQLQASASPVPRQKAAGTKRNVTARQEKRLEKYQAAGLPVFIEMLRAAQATKPGLEITLVGHSMGAIILNRVVRDANLRLANVVYLAAACSVEDFSRSVLPYMKQNRATQFYSLSLHPVAEAGEWCCLDLPPRGSLLVWIDNFLAKPVSEQERSFGRWRDLFGAAPTGEPVIRRFFDNDDGTNLKQRLHFQAFSAGFGNKNDLRPMKNQWNEDPHRTDLSDRGENPLTHGSFSQMPYWNPDFWWRPNTISGGKSHQFTNAP